MEVRERERDARHCSVPAHGISPCRALLLPVFLGGSLEPFRARLQDSSYHRSSLLRVLSSLLPLPTRAICAYTCNLCTKEPRFLGVSNGGCFLRSIQQLLLGNGKVDLQTLGLIQQSGSLGSHEPQQLSGPTGFTASLGALFRDTPLGQTDPDI